MTHREVSLFPTKSVSGSCLCVGDASFDVNAHSLSNGCDLIVFMLMQLGCSHHGAPNYAVLGHVLHYAAFGFSAMVYI